MFNFNKIIKFADIAMILIFIVGLLYTVENIVKKNKTLEQRIIYDEQVLLNSIRIYEYQKRIERLDLLKCNGVTLEKIDSLHTIIDQTNQFIKIRDSLYISERIEKLNSNGL